MTQPIIVIDLDNVLAKSAEGFVETSNSLFGTKLTVKDYGEDWQSMWGVSMDEVDRRAEVMREHRYQSTYEPIVGAFPALIELRKEYQLVLLTSRRSVVEIDTRAWLEKYYPGLFPDIVFAGFWELPGATGGHLLTKGDQYRKLGARHVIDDQLKHCSAAAQGGASAVMFGDYPWNQVDELPAGVTRCNDWAAVLEYFEREKTRG